MRPALRGSFCLFGSVSAGFEPLVRQDAPASLTPKAPRRGENRPSDSSQSPREYQTNMRPALRGSFCLFGSVSAGFEPLVRQDAPASCTPKEVPLGYAPKGRESPERFGSPYQTLKGPQHGPSLLRLCGLLREIFSLQCRSQRQPHRALAENALVAARSTGHCVSDRVTYRGPDSNLAA